MSRTRKQILYTTLVATFIIILALAASPVSAELATSDEMDMVCQNWLSYMSVQDKGWGGATSPSVASVEQIVVDDHHVGNIYLVEPTGYVIVPTLKALSPIKAGSEDYRLDINEADGFAALIRDILLEAYRAYEDIYGSADAPLPEKGDTPFGRLYRDQWDQWAISAAEFQSALSKGEYKALKGVDPLLTARWHQGEPYNKFCPWGDGGQTIVGCVATAAAMIMHFHQWPPYGEDSKTYFWRGDNSCDGSSPGMQMTADFTKVYDWENILDHVTDHDPEVYQDAAAQLCLDVGIGFSMDYGRCASGAYMSPFTTMTFRNFYRYKDQIEYIARPGHTQQEWFDLCREELNTGRPISYGITRHAIVLDGWRIATGAINQLHYNYGWNSSHTTWYATDYVYCNWEGCNASDQDMYVGIEPDREIMFTVDTTIGWLPLEVNFSGTSSLAVDQWTYDFGDGDSAYVPSPTHIYDTQGTFDVTLQVDSADYTRTLDRPGLIIAIADTMISGNAVTSPDSTGEVVIYARNTAPLHTIKIPIVFAGDLALELDSFTTEGCRTEAFEYIQQLHYAPSSKKVTFKLESSTNGSELDLTPGYGPILRVFFTPGPGASSGQTAPLDLSGYLSYLPAFEGPVLDYMPILQSGELVCASCCGGIRGNVDGDPADEVSISDLVYLVEFMFAEGDEPPCWKEADFNASTGIDIADLTYMVNYMFRSGNEPVACP